MITCFHIIVISINMKIPWIVEQINVKDHYETRFEKSPLIEIQTKYHRSPKKSLYFQEMNKHLNNSRHNDILQPRPHRKYIKPYGNGGRNFFNYKEYKRPFYEQSMVKFRRKNYFGDQNNRHSTPIYQGLRNKYAYQPQSKNTIFEHNTSAASSSSTGGFPINRIFDKPLIASPAQAMSSECLECDEKGKDCFMVR